MKRTVSLLAITTGLAAYAACGGGNENTGPVTPPPSATSPAGSASTTSAMPSSSSGGTEAPKPGVADQWKKLGTAMQTAWAAHDIKAVGALYADNATVGAPTAKGWEESKATEAMTHLGAFFTAVPDVKMTLVRGIYKDNMAAMEWYCAGTNTGEMMGEKPTGKKVAQHGLSIVTLEKSSGKIAHENLYMDDATMMAQMGKAPPGAKFRAATDPAPTGEPEMVWAKDGEDTSKNEAAVKAVYAAFEKHDDKAFVASMDDNCTWTDYAQPTDMKGKAAAQKFFGEFSKAFPDLKMNAKNTFAAGDYVVVEAEMTGTLKGALGGVKPTNKSATTHAADVIKLKDGKAVMGSTYSNGLEFAVLYGLMPMPKMPGAGKGPDAKPGDTTKKPDAKPADTTKKPEPKK